MITNYKAPTTLQGLRDKGTIRINLQLIWWWRTPSRHGQVRAGRLLLLLSAQIANELRHYSCYFLPRQSLLSFIYFIFSHSTISRAKAKS
jgi:hypothetical protein